jgi:hybrid cluster-associated redox disulfide protein
MNKKNTGQPKTSFAAQLPAAENQQVQPNKKKSKSFKAKLSKRSISVPIIMPSDDANSAPKYLEVGIDEIERNARRWGIHQQSAKPKPHLKASENIQEGDGPITQGMLIKEVVEKYPQTLEVLIEAGLHCIGCTLSAFDSIEAGCALHGMSQEEIQALVRKMNKKLQEQPSKTTQA